MNLERRIARPGYAMVELQPAHVEARDVSDADTRLDDLELHLEMQDREIGLAHSELLEVEQQARAAPEVEGGQCTAVTRSDKHELLRRLAALQHMQIATQRQLQAELRASLISLLQERYELERLQAQHDDILGRLVSTVENLLEDLRGAVDVRVELCVRERSWQARLENLARRELRDSNGVTANKEPRRSTPPTPAAGRHKQTSAARRPEPARKWAVYDPDAGKLVGTLRELLRLLARWYPNLRSEAERVQEFLTLPNAEPLPDGLRRELEEAGYLEPTEPARS